MAGVVNDSDDDADDDIDIDDDSDVDNDDNGVDDTKVKVQQKAFKTATSRCQERHLAFLFVNFRFFSKHESDWFDEILQVSALRWNNIATMTISFEYIEMMLPCDL